MVKLISICSIFCCFLQVSSYSQNNSNWINDIEVFDKNLRNTHVNLFHKLPESKYAQLISLLKEDSQMLDTIAFNYKILEILSAIGDMHTRATIKYNSVLPFHIFLFDEGFFIRAVDPRHEILLGDQILAINDIPIEEIYIKIKSLTSADNEYGYMNNSMSLLTITDILKHLKIIPDQANDIPITFLKNGKKIIKPIDSPLPEEKMIHVFQKSNNEIPLYIRSMLSGMYHYEFLADNSTFYIQLNSIRDPSQSLSFDQLFDEIITSIDNTHPQKIVLDLRWNGGGNDPSYRSALPKFVAALIRNNLNSPKKFYTVISRYTASAAQHLVNDLEYLTETTFIGEPTKQNVHFFSDSRWFVLPNSKIKVAASAGWLQNYIPKGIEDRKLFEPDIFIPWSFESFKENKDLILDYIESN